MGTQTVCLVFFLFFISLSSSFFGYSRQYRHLKYLVQKSLSFVCTGGHNIYPPKRACAWNAKFPPAYMKVVDVRTDD